jgi:hypothetical protein
MTGQGSATAITELDDRSDGPVFELDASVLVLVLIAGKVLYLQSGTLGALDSERGREGWGDRCQLTSENPKENLAGCEEVESGTA